MIRRRVIPGLSRVRKMPQRWARSLRRTLMVVVLGGLTAQADTARLKAISMIESGDDDRAVGSAGEISRYQIKVSVWKQYSRSRAYQNVNVSTRVAGQYLKALEALYRGRTGRDPSNFDRYVMWNAGPAYYAKRGFAPSRVHRIVRERATRFANLCEALGDGDEGRSAPGIREPAASAELAFVLR